MKHLYLTSPIPPSVNHYLSYRVVSKNGRHVAISYKASEANKYQRSFTQYVKEEITKQGWELVPNKEQHFYVDAVFYFNRVDMDANNYFKCMLDAITDSKSIWLDDNVVCERVNRIYYDSENPRVELCIYPVDYIGIFDDISQLEKFESNCVGCSRYKRNCSVLQKAKEGHIQEEIRNFICSKHNPQKLI